MLTRPCPCAFSVQSAQASERSGVSLQHIPTLDLLAVVSEWQAPTPVIDAALLHEYSRCWSDSGLGSRALIVSTILEQFRRCHQRPNFLQTAREKQAKKGQKHMLRSALSGTMASHCT